MSEAPAAEVVVYTDGACSGNPGPGGWGAILMYGDKRKELNGGEAESTNNRMELMAAIGALEALKRPCNVELHTDSKYLQDGISKWIKGWKRNGWLTAERNRSRTRSCGNASTRRARSTRSSGNGSRATPATPRTNARTNWRARAWPSSKRKSAGSIGELFKVIDDITATLTDFKP